jgi:hypothetical protein
MSGSTTELIVILPFGPHQTGDLISDAGVIAAILGSENRKKVVQFAVSGGTYTAGSGTGTTTGTTTVAGGSGGAGTGLTAAQSAALTQATAAEATDAAAIASQGTLIAALQSQLASGSAPTPAATVRGTYTASGPIALTDDVSEVISTVPVTMTLAAGTTNNRLHVVSQAGPGAVTLTAPIDGVSQSVSLNSTGPLRDSITLRWLADLSTYKPE